jgi:hypothetical protein
MNVVLKDKVHAGGIKNQFITSKKMQCLIIAIKNLFIERLALPANPLNPGTNLQNHKHTHTTFH